MSYVQYCHDCIGITRLATIEPEPELGIVDLTIRSVIQYISILVIYIAVANDVMCNKFGSQDSSQQLF